jgi:hypothetical protein
VKYDFKILKLSIVKMRGNHRFDCRLAVQLLRVALGALEMAVWESVCLCPVGLDESYKSASRRAKAGPVGLAQD